jgi:hypothetical protein
VKARRLRMRKSLLVIIYLILSLEASAQVDTSYIYNTNTPYGSLDIRIAKSSTRYYYLQEGKTFSFRENSPGVRTNTFKDMTAWDSSPYEEGNLREVDGSVDNFVMNYRLLKPQGYDPNYGKGYPIIFMMHGSGEHGNCWHSRCYHATPDYSPVDNDPPAPTDPNLELLNNDHSLLHGGKIYLDAVNLAGNKKPDDPSLPERAFPGFVLFPQNLIGWNNGSVQDAMRILRLVIKKYNIDEDRVYINGLSHGAHGVFEAVKRAPWLFTSVVVMSAVDDGFITNANMESAISDIPIWYFQGELDTTPYPAKTKSYINKFRSAGTVVRYTEYADVGHTTWNLAYKEPDFFTWMLGKRKSQLHSFAGSTSICSGSDGLELRFADGYFAYQWQKNGQTISGATSNVYMATTPGTYRGRFSRVSTSPSENQWTPWSEAITVGQADTQEAHINQVGTVVLKDLNNKNTAYLESANEAAHYYWYKDGALINFPGDEDDTLKAVTISPGNCTGTCSNSGAYTLVTSSYDQCKSNPSGAKQLFFSDQAPVNITAPGELKGSAITASSIMLSWQDKSTNENGFEIWRRRKKSGTEFTPWEMATLTEANVKSFADSKLFPSSEYQYKIRAVSNSGRSEYFPNDNAVVLVTAPDTQPPAAPENLGAVWYDVDRARVYWRSAVDDTGIDRYIITYDGNSITTPDTTFISNTLAINSRYTFSVKAVDLGGNEGPEATVPMVTIFNGMYYEHSPGSWPYLDSVDWSRPDYKGYLETVTLRKKTQDDYFYFRFKGYLYIESPGTYQFRTSSNDGSRLYINDKRLVNNDGIHEMKTITSGGVTLASGAQKFRLDFFDYTKADSVAVEYKGPDTGGAWEVIPISAFRSSLVVGNEEAAGDPFVVNVYPNPTVAENVNVLIKSAFREQIAISLYDAIGRPVHEEHLDNFTSENVLKIIPSYRLHAGCYFLKVVQGGRSVVRRVIIQNE